MTNIPNTHSSSKAPVLMFESATEFGILHKKLEDEIKPQGAIEEHYVEEVAALIWEIRRLRDCRLSTIKEQHHKKLAGLLRQQPISQIEQQPPAWAYFEDENAKKEISEVLARRHLDESAITADVILLAKDKLETLDQMLASARVRLDRTLRSIQEYRVYFADRARRSANLVLQSDDVPGIQADQERAR